LDRPTHLVRSERLRYRRHPTTELVLVLKPGVKRLKLRRVGVRKGEVGSHASMLSSEQPDRYRTGG
jgi:hypothetical protein